MKIGFVQYSPRLMEVEKNIKRFEKILGDSSVELLVLPELAFSGYNFESRDDLQVTAVKVQEIVIPFLIDLAKKREMTIVSGLAYLEGDKIFNSAVLFRPDGEFFIYKKSHLFANEKALFDFAEADFRIHDIGGVKIGMLVCFDHLFPEAARSLALQGAQIICHPSNLVLPELAMLTTRVRSIENRVFWILADRVGHEVNSKFDLTYNGQSRIYDTRGNCLISADSVEEGLFVVEIDPEQALDKGLGDSNNLFGDRQPEGYLQIVRPN
ncbi:MAG: nitrilase [Spirochaetales bacterium]|nr:nitrilase [Spirochaetales bacterium]